MTSPPAAHVPEIRYARSEGLNIAYQVFGQGPVDVLLVPGFISHIEYSWQEPLLARFLRRLSMYARVIAFDKRGMGLSDRDPRQETPSLVQRIRDIEAVMDAAGSTTAALLAWSEGGAAAITFAYERPGKTSALLLMETTPRFSSADDFPAGVPREMLEVFIDVLQQDWGTGVGLELYAPSLADDARARSWWSSYQRLAATPGAVAATLRMHLDVDVRPVLAKLSVPCLVFHRTYDMLIPVECGRYLAEHIPGAVLVEQDSEDHMYWVGHQDQTHDAIRAVLARAPGGQELGIQRRHRRQSDVGWESLTAAELDIAHLVAAGMTNRHIAERLTVSPRTVQTHVTHILTKLGRQRRSEIAAEATRRSG